MPCIIFFNFPLNINRSNATKIGNAAIIKKNTVMEYVSVILSIYEPVIPAMKFAMADAVNHNPNNNPANFLGESLLTYDNPTGDTHNSPVVWKK